MTLEAWVTVAVIGGVLAVLVSDRLPPAHVILAGTVVLFLLGVIDAAEAFQGFANPAPITVAALYVVAGAVQRTGALEWLTARTLPAVNGGPNGRSRPSRRDLLRFLPPAALPSGFLNNTTIVAMLAPRVMEWSRRAGRPPSGFLIPLSYASILGGLLTTIGTSTTLIVSGLLVASGEDPLGLFEITRVGLPLAVLGIGVLLLVAPRLLPDRGFRPVGNGSGGVREFTVELDVAAHSPIAGCSVEAAGLRNLEGVYLVQVERDGETIAPVAPNQMLAPADRLVFAGNIERVVDLHRMPGLVPAEQHHVGAAGDPRTRRFHEMVVSPMSSLVGSTLKEADFRNRYGAAVVAIHRAGERVPGKLGTIRLRAGDVLLVLADSGLPRRLRDHHDFLVVSTLPEDTPPRRESARIVELTILALLVVVGLGLLDILQGALAAGLVLIGLRVVSPAEARRSVDLDVLVMIAASFGLGAAVAASGLADTLAGGMTDALGGFGQIGLVAGILLATMVLTELVTNNAAAVLVFPIGMAAAAAGGLDAHTVALTIAVGASASFLTPIGYQTNTMVYGMGGYHFTDFARTGAPLSLAVLLAVPPIVLAVT